MRKETAPSEKTKKDELASHKEIRAGVRDQGKVFDDENQEPGEEVTSREDPEALPHKETEGEANAEDTSTGHPPGAADSPVVHAGTEGPYSIRAMGEPDPTGGSAPGKDTSSGPPSERPAHTDQGDHDSSSSEANAGPPNEGEPAAESTPLATSQGDASTAESIPDSTGPDTSSVEANSEQATSAPGPGTSSEADSAQENKPATSNDGDEPIAETISETAAQETVGDTENVEETPSQQDAESPVEGGPVAESTPLATSQGDASTAESIPDSTGPDTSSDEGNSEQATSAPGPGTSSEADSAQENKPETSNDGDEPIVETTSEIAAQETGADTENVEETSSQQDAESPVEGDPVAESTPFATSQGDASTAESIPDSTGPDTSSGEGNAEKTSSAPGPGTFSEADAAQENKPATSNDGDEPIAETTSETAAQETGADTENVEESSSTPDTEKPAATKEEVTSADASDSTDHDFSSAEANAGQPVEGQPATTSAPQPVERTDKQGGETPDDASGKDTTDHQDMEIAAHEDDIHDDGDELVHADYSQYSKEELVGTIKKLTKIDDFKKLDVVLNIVDPLFQDKKQAERKAALEKYISEGGSEEDFAYKNELDQRYDAYYKLIKERKNKFYGDLGRQKLENYQKASGLLEKLRHLVDGEESTTSINAIKEIQEEWKTIGQVPPQHVRNLWASYNALMDRFYDNRSIYFELKELDRRKNLKAKEELCVRAEKLEEVANLKDAIKELNELHNEYKHIGPVPKARQEALWQRFKAASDNVYARRKTYYEDLKKDLEVNLEAKARLRDEVQPYATFDSDRIVDWNSKTQEILDIQKRWEAIGGLPRDRAHEVNKPFWSAFKRFFNNKNGFFKKLEGQREGNLKLKEVLVAKANELKESTDWNQTANDLKNLQNEWRNIGPVPEKHRNEVYQRFKKACDFFFENRRNRFKEVEKGYEKNLKQKEEICQKILKLAREGAGDIGQLEALQEEWNNIGFVPKNAIRSSQDMFARAVDQFIASSSLGEDEKNKLKITTRLTSLKGTPNANRKLNKKEFTLRRQITNLENDISLWKNNLEFFANSKNADQVRQEFDEKIEKAKRQLEELKAQLKIIKDI